MCPAGPLLAPPSRMSVILQAFIHLLGDNTMQRYVMKQGALLCQTAHWITLMHSTVNARNVCRQRQYSAIQTA